MWVKHLYPHSKPACVAPCLSAGLGARSSSSTSGNSHPAHSTVQSCPLLVHAWRSPTSPCPALQTSPFPLVHGAARKGRVGFSARGRRRLLSRASGMEGISLIPGLVPQKAPCVLSVSFSGCCAMRVQVSKTHVRRDKHQRSC